MNRRAGARAISDFYSGLIEGYGIRLIPFIHGQIDEVVDAFMNESLGGVSGEWNT